MTRRRPGIGFELLPVLLILFCLGGTLSLVLTMHRRVAASRKRAAPPVVAALTNVPMPRPDPAPLPAPVAKPGPEPRRAPASAPPVADEDEDPTAQALARLSAAESEQIEEARKADAKAASLEAARLAALASSTKLRRREALVKTQINKLTAQASALEAELDEAALQRDVLAKEIDKAKAALSKAMTRSSYAVLPLKGANGTWRRPIIIECRNGTATLQPRGPTFNIIELSNVFGPRSSPIVAAVAREIVRSQALATPDGAPAVPYIFFVIRPDGIRPYYNARAQLEPLGIAFGYELVNQDMEIEYPDLDNLDEWDGTGPIPGLPTIANRPRAGGGGLDSSTAPRQSNQGRIWGEMASGFRPGNANGNGSGYGNGGGGGVGPGGGRSGSSSADTFVWPARPSGIGPGAGGGSFDGSGSVGGAGSGGGSGRGNDPANGGVGGTGGDRLPEGFHVVGEDVTHPPGTAAGGRTGTGSEGGFSGNPLGDSTNGSHARGGAGMNTTNPSSSGLTSGAGSELVPVGADGLPSLETAGSAGGRSSTNPEPMLLPGSGGGAGNPINPGAPVGSGNGFETDANQPADNPMSGGPSGTSASRREAVRATGRCKVKVKVKVKVPGSRPPT